MRKDMLAAMILAFMLSGCLEDRQPTVAYIRSDTRQPISEQQVEADRAACQTERAALAEQARARRQTEGYDLIGNLRSSSREEMSDQDCMKVHGYEPGQVYRKGLFN